MENYRLKMKIGSHEFEAEGPPEAVQAQFQAFKELVAMSSSQPATSTEHEVKPLQAPLVEKEVSSESQKDDGGVDAQVSKIMKHDDRVVSLTVRASNTDEAVLLILYGQKHFRNNDSVTGNEVMQGLTVTGQRVKRVDRVLEKAGRDGTVIVIGEHRAKRYRLTNRGFAKARDIAAELIATVA